MQRYSELCSKFFCFSYINNILSETIGLVSYAVYRITIACMVWFSIAIEKLPRAIKHSRVLRDLFREWHYTKIGCTEKYFQKRHVDYARMTCCEIVAATIVCSSCHFPIWMSNIRFSNEILFLFPLSLSLSLSLPFSSFLFSFPEN